MTKIAKKKQILGKGETINANPISRLLRVVFEMSAIKKLIGVPITAMMALYGVVALPTHAFEYSPAEQYLDAATYVPIITETTYQYPVRFTYGISQGFSIFHPGIDIRAPRNTTVYAIAPGIVIETGNQIAGYGHYIRVLHENEMVTLYAHLDEVRVKSGEKVTKDTEMGTIGMTGWTTGPHLHFEMHQNDKGVDPKNYIAFFMKN